MKKKMTKKNLMIFSLGLIIGCVSTILILINTELGSFVDNVALSRNDEAEMNDTYSVAKESYQKNEMLFNKIYEIIDEKGGDYLIDISGLKHLFIQDKMSVFMHYPLPKFSEDEIDTIEEFFSGHDDNQLDMRQISSGAEFTMFSKGTYETRLYKIIIIPVPGKNQSPQTLYNILGGELLNEDWAIIKTSSGYNDNTHVDKLVTVRQFLKLE